MTNGLWTQRVDAAYNVKDYGWVLAVDERQVMQTGKSLAPKVKACLLDQDESKVTGCIDMTHG
jgi:hypothetical protein